jgi:hypothetical protein
VAVLAALVALFSVVKLTPSALCSLNRRRMRVDLSGPALHLEIPVGARAATMTPASLPARWNRGQLEARFPKLVLLA